MSLDDSLDVLQLSVRTGQALREAEILTLRELVRYTPAGLLELPNVGQRSLGEIRRELAGRGLALKKDSKA